MDHVAYMFKICVCSVQNLLNMYDPHTQYVEMGRPLILTRHSVSKSKPPEPMQSDVFVADKVTQLEVPSDRQHQDRGEESAESHTSDTLKAEGGCNLAVAFIMC